MKIFDSPYFRMNKLALQFLGQWPFQSDFEHRWRRIIIYLGILSIYVPKIIKLFESLHDLDIVIECLPILVLHTTAHMKFFFWTINTKNMQKLYSTIQRDWDTTTNENDRALLHKYWSRGQSFMVFYSVPMFSILILNMTTPVIPRILDVVSPLNESRPRLFLYETEYFVDQDKYYTQILLHAYMTVPISVTIIVFYDNMITCYVTHACGMFAIVKSHLESLHISNKNSFEENMILERKSALKHITHCVELHKHAIEFIGLAASCSSLPLLGVVVLNTAILTVTGVTTIIKLDDQPSEAARFAAFTVGGIFHLYGNSYQGHLLMDMSASIYTSACDNEWYNFPPDIQKMLIPIMMRSRKPCIITAGNMFVLSLESFGEILRKAMSFFTVLSSTR